MLQLIAKHTFTIVSAHFLAPQYLVSLMRASLLEGVRPLMASLSLWYSALLACCRLLIRSRCRRRFSVTLVPRDSVYKLHSRRRPHWLSPCSGVPFRSRIRICIPQIQSDLWTVTSICELPPNTKCTYFPCKPNVAFVIIILSLWSDFFMK